MKVNKISKEKIFGKFHLTIEMNLKSLKQKLIFMLWLNLYSSFIKKSKIKLNNKVSSFKFHPMIKLIAEFDHNVQNGEENVHPFQITEFYQIL